MSFFVTSVAKGDGGNYGGLAGADAHCQMLAQAAGRGNVKWVAYLSTQGPGAVNARDRIGQGPWANSRGGIVARDVAHLHGDTVELAQIGNNLSKTTVLTEKQTELATIFYTIGSKKQLKEAGIVESKGGVLGLGKTLKPSGVFVESAYKPLNTDQEMVIQIPAEKAQVLSAQPVSSYVLQPISKDMVELRIVDAKAFRKIKQLVILTT